MHPDYGYFEESQLGKPYDVKLLKRLYPFIRPYKVMILWSIVLVLGITILDLALPYVTKVAIDRYIVPQTKDTLEDGLQTDETKNRYLEVDLKKPRQRKIVEKYKELFKIEGQTALISFNAVKRLKKIRFKNFAPK